MGIKSLLDNQYAPLTYQIGFLEGEFEHICCTYLKWRKHLQSALSYEFINTNLAGGLERLDPLVTPWDRELLICTGSKWVAYFNNGLRVSDPESPIGHLCTIVPCRGVVVHCVPDRSALRLRGALRIYGAVSFALFVPHQADWLNQERYICAMNDGGEWEFLLEGKQQPFEDPKIYKARSIQDRFTPEMLEKYCAALGIVLFDENFYGGRALVNRMPDLGSQFPRMSLKEARIYTLIR